MPLNKGLREFVELFNATEVEYLVLGAFALTFHGIPGCTADFVKLANLTDELNARSYCFVHQAIGFAVFFAVDVGDGKVEGAG